jgi:hypothetical protein
MNDNSTPNQFQDRREERRERREEWRQSRRGGEWMLGVILIVIAGIIFLQYQHIYVVNNWWALFILLPAMGSFATAWQMARNSDGQFSARARNPFIVGIVLVLVTAMFLFNLNWAIWGPVLLALAGVSLLLNGIIKN